MSVKKESEKVLEAKFAATLNTSGKAWCIKLSSQYVSGLPDRVVFINGYTVFVEFKTTGCKPTRVQELRHEKLRSLGFEVYVIDNSDDLKKLVNYILEIYGIEN